MRSAFPDQGITSNCRTVTLMAGIPLALTTTTVTTSTCPGAGEAADPASHRARRRASLSAAASCRRAAAFAPRHLTLSEALHADEGPSRPPSVAQACRLAKPGSGPSWQSVAVTFRRSELPARLPFPRAREGSEAEVEHGWREGGRTVVGRAADAARGQPLHPICSSTAIQARAWASGLRSRPNRTSTLAASTVSTCPWPNRGCATQSPTA